MSALLQVDGLGKRFGGFVAQRYLARHPAHPAKVILSSTSHHFGLARKIHHFGRLGGPEAAAATRDFWERPGPETWAAYEVHCRHLYNTQPKNPDAGGWMLPRPDILFEHTATELPGMDVQTVSRIGHAPTLEEPEALAAIEN